MMHESMNAAPHHLQPFGLGNICWECETVLVVAAATHADA